MLFGQPHLPTNDLIHKCINYMYDQIAIACKVLFSWNDVIEQKKLKSINKDTKSMIFLSCKSRAFNQNNSIIFLRKIVSSMCGQLISLCIWWQAIFPFPWFIYGHFLFSWSYYMKLTWNLNKDIHCNLPPTERISLPHSEILWEIEMFMYG